jgi:hypothetical protein
MNDLFDTLLLYRKKNFGQGNIFITKNNWLVGSHDELTNLNSKIYSGNTNLDQLINPTWLSGRPISQILGEWSGHTGRMWCFQVEF